MFLIPKQSFSFHCEIYATQEITYIYFKYLYGDCGIFSTQKLRPYQTSTKPALQSDDVSHHLFVKSVLEQLLSFCLKEHLNRSKWHCVEQ